MSDPRDPRLGMPSTDIFRRGKSVLSLAAGIAGQELRHRVRSGFGASSENIGASELRARVQQARLMVESLGRLKGALMKAGQLLSIDASDLLPPEAAEILAALQGNAEAVDFSVMRGVLEAELGVAQLNLLEDLDPLPAASASIGQVHKARVADFGPVAVKIQYPGIAESIDSDMAMVEKLGASMVALTRRDIDMGGLFAELRGILHYEADYQRERAFLDRFATLLSSDERFVVPRSVPSLSSTRVLTMSWEEGASLGAWIRSQPPRPQRIALGRALLDLYCQEFFRWGVVQTDPNFGNFLVRDDERITLLDFGASVEYDEPFRRSYVALLRAVALRDRDSIVDEAIQFDILDARESGDTRDLFVEMMLSAAEPFEPSRQPFVFADSDYAARSRDTGTRFMKSLAFTPPPRRLIFLHRKLGGLFQLLKRLDLELDLSPYWEQMVQ